MQNINELVATHVMGWRKETVANISELLPFYDVWVEGETKYVRVENFNPSTNIADAWEVVEKLSQFDQKYLVWHNESKVWCFVFAGGTFLRYSADAKTAPLAICLAALKAVGVDVDG